MSEIWFVLAIVEYFFVSIAILANANAIVHIGLLIVYVINFWGCKIVEVLKEQK